MRKIFIVWGVLAVWRPGLEYGEGLALRAHWAGQLMVGTSFGGGAFGCIFGGEH
jgi:hypothetical protein